jgi:hypothetical protein
MSKPKTVFELAKMFARLVKQGKGDYPVQMMEIEEGMTVATDITVELAQKYDGDRVWIYSNGETHLPEWLGKKSLH